VFASGTLKMLLFSWVFGVFFPADSDPYALFRNSYQYLDLSWVNMVLVGRVTSSLKALEWLEMWVHYARFNDVALHRSFLRPGVSLRQGLPEVEVAPQMQIDFITAVALILSVFLLAYLTVTLLYPEKF
jgi:K+-transporting ATPase KdpF subunit